MMLRRFATPYSSRTSGRTGRRNRMLAVLGACVVVVISTFGIINISQQASNRALATHQREDTLSILGQVKSVTSPNGSYATQAQKAGAATVDHLILCLENHSDQNAARTQHRAVPATMKGCPTS